MQHSSAQICQTSAPPNSISTTRSPPFVDKTYGTYHWNENTFKLRIKTFHSPDAWLRWNAAKQRRSKWTASMAETRHSQLPLRWLRHTESVVVLSLSCCEMSASKSLCHWDKVDFCLPDKTQAAYTGIPRHGQNSVTEMTSVCEDRSEWWRAARRTVLWGFFLWIICLTWLINQP